MKFRKSINFMEKKWFYFLRFFSVRVAYWEADVKFCTEEELRKNIEIRLGNRSRGDIDLYELTPTGEKIARMDILDKIFEEKKQMA